MSRLFLFIGRSGCGKGTQAELLLEYLNKTEPGKPIFYWETGKHLREFAAENSYASKLAKGVMEAGGRLPDFLAAWNWARGWLANYTGQETLVFDGIARSLGEAKMFDTAVRFFPDLQPIIIYLNISRETAVARLTSRGRQDDGAKGVESRLNWFDRDVVPALEFFRADPFYKFLDIDGEPSVEAIHQALVSQL